MRYALAREILRRTGSSSLLLAWCVSVAPAEQPVIAVVGGTIIDPATNARIEHGVILIRDGRIAAVGPEVAVPERAEVVHAEHAWVIPGLIDAHVHFFQSGGLYTRPDGLDLTRQVPYAREIADIRGNLDDTFRRYLRCGITAVVDVGGPFWNFEVRARADDAQEAPRVAVAGPLLSSWQPPRLDVDDPPIIAVRSVDDAIAQVRRQAERRPDLVKIWWIVHQGQLPSDFAPIARAIVDESHRLGIRVAVHATQLETARAALQAGADVLVHSVDDAPVDQPFIDLLLQRHAIYITTLVVHGGYLSVYSGQFQPLREEASWANPFALGTLFDFRHFAPADLPDGIPALMQARPPVRESASAQRNLVTLTRAGVQIAAGTDAGNVGTLPGPSLFREFAAMARAGLTPSEILRQATVGGAAVFGRDDLGRIAPGAAADLLVLDADPSVDIANCSRLRRIIKAGHVIDPERLAIDSPPAAAQRLLDAMNAHDPAVFASILADAAAMRDETGAHAGAEAVRAFAAARCAAGQHRQLIERMIHDQEVIDRYRLFGADGAATGKELATYRVVEGKIVSAQVAADGG